MRRTVIPVVALVVLAMVGVPMVGLAAVDGPRPVPDHAGMQAQTGTNATENTSVAPGERLAGVVGVQRAEVESAVGQRAFGLAVARAATNESKAGVVAGQFEDIETRLDRLEERMAELNESRANGNISHGRYRAEIATLSARIEATRELANQTAAESEGLPADALEAKGVNTTAIQTLQRRAHELGGARVSEIARSITGAHDADGRGNGPDGVPDIPGNVTDENASDGSTGVSVGNGNKGGVGDGAGDTVDNATDTVTNTTDSTTDTVDNTTNSTTDTVDNTTDSATDTLTNSTDSTTDTSTNTTDSTTDTVINTTDSTTDTVINTTDSTTNDGTL